MEQSDHRHVTHENKGTNEQRNENKAYVPMGDAQYTAEQVLEMEANKEGRYDEDGFFVLPRGDFIDPYGYYFDEEGYDDFGGYYDDDGYYVPGEEYHDEYYEKYDVDHYIPESLEEEAQRLAPFTEHVYPAIQWLNDQAADKKHVVQISGLAVGLNEDQVTKFVNTRIPEITEVGKLTYLKDPKYKKSGVAYFTSTNKDKVASLLKLHSSFYAGKIIKTYLMGYPYDSDEYSEHMYDNFKGQKMLDEDYYDDEVDLVEKLDDQGEEFTGQQSKKPEEEKKTDGDFQIGKLKKKQQ